MRLPNRGRLRSCGVRLRATRRLSTAAALSFTLAEPLTAQTDYYNTSAGRPVRIEDAIPVELRAIELDVAPLRLERSSGRTYQWSLHPEVAVGIMPRTQLQLGVPLAYVDEPVTSSRGVAGLEISALHALNVETRVPALALAADLSLPVGSLGGDATYGTLKGLVTRTFPWARFHVNAQATAGPAIDANDTTATDAREPSRWLAGLAVDKTFPLRSLLVTAESFAEQPIVAGEPVALSAGAGLRYQLSPRWAMDVGVGRRFSGNDRAWYTTFGSAYVVGWR